MRGAFTQATRRGACVFPVIGGVLAAIAVFLVYWPASQNGFVSDDWAVIRTLWSISEPASRWQALLSPPADFTALFRPLTTLTFLLQLWAGQSDPGPFHIASLAIHAANVFLVTLLAWMLLGEGDSRLSNRPLLAALCGLIYGLHPALTEPVIWISARSDLLLAFFLCLALILDRALSDSDLKRSIAVGLAFFAAMLAKEAAIGFMAALPVAHAALGRDASGASQPASLAQTIRRNRWVYAALLGACVLYLDVRYMAAGPLFGLGDMVFLAPHINTAGEHFMVVVATLAYQVRDAIWPFQDIMPVRRLSLPIGEIGVLPAIAASAPVVAAALLSACSRHAIRVPALLFAAFLASLLPVANIVPIPTVAVPDEVSVAARYLAFPLVFACLSFVFLVRLAMTSLVGHARYGKALFWTLAGAWILASAAGIRVTVPLWKNDTVLNLWALDVGGPNFRRYAGYGWDQMRVGNLLQARDAFLKAVSLRDDKYSAPVWSYLGAAEAALGNPHGALRAFRRALELGAEDIRTRLNVAALERATGNPQAAAEVLEEGLRRMRFSGRPHKQEVQLLYELGVAYARLGRTTEAVTQLNAALGLTHDPGQRKSIEEALKSVASK